MKKQLFFRDSSSKNQRKLFATRHEHYVFIFCSPISVQYQWKIENIASAIAQIYEFSVRKVDLPITFDIEKGYAFITLA